MRLARMKLAPKLAAGIFLGIALLSGCTSLRPGGVSPEQADKVLASLDMQTIINACGRGNIVNYRVLTYRFGSFQFDQPPSVLMMFSSPGEEPTLSWVNVHRDSEDENPDLRKGHDALRKLEVSAAGMRFMSVEKYEGERALKVFDSAPCLSSLLENAKKSRSK